MSPRIRVLMLGVGSGIVLATTASALWLRTGADAAAVLPTAMAQVAVPQETADPVGANAKTRPPSDDAKPAPAAPSKAGTDPNGVRPAPAMIQGKVTRNPVRVDKKDDSDFFTTAGGGQTYNPCLKVDGTPYRGPGTALDPFAPVNPCLPRRTAESFAPPLPTITDSDVRIRPSGPPTVVPAGFGPEPVVGSDYRI